MRDYQRFLYDYANEFVPDLAKHIQYEDNEGIFDEDGKESVYKEGYIFRNEIQKPYVAPTLAKRANRDKIMEFTSRFMDEHSDELSEPGPVKIFTFGQKEVQPLYDLFGIDADIILKAYDLMVQETYYGKISKFFTGWVNKAPHKILLIAMIIESLQSGYDEVIECAEYLFGFTEYPILYREYWRTDLREDVMELTIEHLAGKFKLKQLKSLQALLKYDTTVAVNFYKDPLTKGVDNVYMDYIYRVRNQMNAKMRNISRAYYKNIETNATLHKNATKFDDGNLADQQGVATNMAAIIDKTVGKFSSGDVNSGMVRLAAGMSQVDKGNLNGMINQIYITKDNKIAKFVEDIITYYFKKNPESTYLPAGEFLNFGLASYKSISVSKDPQLTDIKQILKFWMDDIIGIRGMYDREATVRDYNRGVYNYFILQINYYQQ